ncbi:MAG: HupE/UreJ family protein [Xanthobacteraceae bacterium]|nr:HupE/UreJ family protein [Xanthobacteraceae bacterium]
MRTKLDRLGLAVATLIASTVAADAHIIGTRLGDFYAGAAHPATDPQDVILWIAVGVLAGSLGASRGRWLVLLFPLGLLAGLLIGASVPSLPGSPVMDAGLILVLGLLLAAGARIPATALGMIGFALAVLRGAANAGGIGPETNLPLFAAGLACTGYVAITLIMAITIAFRRAEAGDATAWRGIALRAFGGWIAAIGMMMVGFALASHAGA